jgi:hypothetical protein
VEEEPGWTGMGGQGQAKYIVARAFVSVQGRRGRAGLLIGLAADLALTGVRSIPFTKYSSDRSGGTKHCLPLSAGQLRKEGVCVLGMSKNVSMYMKNSVCVLHIRMCLVPACWCLCSCMSV